MRVVCPYVGAPLPETRGALDEQADAVEYADVSSDVEAYWRLLCGLWADAESFVLVEQDVVPAPGALAELKDCPSVWCSMPSTTTTAGEPNDLQRIGTPRDPRFPKPHQAAALRCNRFDRLLMLWQPGVFSRIGAGSRHWGNVWTALARIHSEVHVHRDTPVRHLVRRTREEHERRERDRLDYQFERLPANHIARHQPLPRGNPF